MTHRALALAGIGLAAAVAGCGPGNGGTTLTVLAAASLTEPFEVLAEEYEQEHTDVTVRLVLDSSATLATQVLEGAPADVLATADLATMETVVEARAVEEPVTFALNEMVLVTPSSDPAGVDSVADLDREGVSYVRCVTQAPCGAVAAELLDAHGTAAEPSSLEVDVKAVLARVVSGEVDAGLVYATDARAAGAQVRTVPVPGAQARPNRYSVAVVRGARQAELGRQWVDLVRSAPGRRLLATAGFRLP